MTSSYLDISHSILAVSIEPDLNDGSSPERDGPLADRRYADNFIVSLLTLKLGYKVLDATYLGQDLYSLTARAPISLWPGVTERMMVVGLSRDAVGACIMMQIVLSNHVFTRAAES